MNLLKGADPLPEKAKITKENPQTKKNKLDHPLFLLKVKSKELPPSSKPYKKVRNS